MKNFFFALLLLVTAYSRASAQCASPVKISAENILEITDPFQLTFLHQIPKNRVDTLVAELLNPNIKHLPDYEKIVQEIAATRSQEAFLLLYTAGMRPLVYDDLSDFVTLCERLNYYGAHKLLNLYFLKNAVNEPISWDGSDAEWAFRMEIMLRCEKLKPDAHFCVARNQEFTLEEIQSRIDTTFSEYVTCKIPIRVTKQNIYEVHNPYEFTFLHREPQNKTDSVVYMLRFGPFDTTSARKIQKMAAGQSHEAFLFLYACCAVDEKKEIGTNHFHNIANQVNIWGGFEAMNNYFLDSAVPANLEMRQFRVEVLKRAEAKNPELFYCHQPTVMELYEAEMKNVDPGPYDAEIVKIIRKYSDTQKPNCAKNITHAVLQLPFVEDVLWDGCYEKLAIYPAYYNLMVIINIGDKKVERYYSMQGARFRYFGIRLGKKCRFGRTVETNDHELVFTNAGYAPGAIKAARAYCEQKAEEREERAKASPKED
jgi:hypothetical protein